MERANHWQYSTRNLNCLRARRRPSSDKFLLGGLHSFLVFLLPLNIIFLSPRYTEHVGKCYLFPGYCNLTKNQKPPDLIPSKVNNGMLFEF